MNKLTVHLMLVIAAAAGPSDDKLKGHELTFRLDSDGVAQPPERILELVRARLEHLMPKSDLVVELRGKKMLLVRTRTRDKSQLDRIKALVSQRGKVEFRITVEKEKDDGAFQRALAIFRAARAKGGAADQRHVIRPRQLNDRDRKKYPHGLCWCRLGSEADDDLKGRAARAEDGTHWFLVELDRQNVSNGDLCEIAVERNRHGIDPVPVELFDVTFHVKPGAQARMQKLTDPADRHLAIVFDGRVVLAPLLRASLRSTAMISGRYSKTEADAIGALLRSEALERAPVLVSERTCEFVPAAKR